MISNRNDENDSIYNAKKNSDNLINRRHSIAHTNFRKAIYRSLSFCADNDGINDKISYVKYCVKVFFLCLFIVFIGAVIKFIWSQ